MSKQILILLLKSIGILLVSVVVGFLLLLCVYMLPTEPIQEHIAQSIDTVRDEGDYPFVHSWIDMWRDNFTDYLMINHAGYGGDEPLVEKAVNVYSVNATYQGQRMLPSQKLIVGYTDLVDLEENDITLGRDSYSRYWHGYLVLLKPLLSLLTYDGIRILNAVAQTSLLLVALFLMWKKDAKWLMIPFVLIWALLVPTDTSALLQYSDIYYIYVIGSIVLLQFYDKLKNTNGLYYTFLLLGIATSYFDFLTYPLVSLGVPLGICLYLSKDKTIKDGIKQLVLFSAFWTAGYLGMWFCKWLLVSILTDGSIMSVVSEKVGFWTGDTSDLGEHITLWGTTKLLFGKMIPNPAFLVSAAYIVVLAVISFVRKTFSKVQFVLYGILALYPFAWFAVISGHSHTHYWFTNKELVIFMFALMLIFTADHMIVKQKSGQKKRKKKKH